jgi:hypothetical protein
MISQAHPGALDSAAASRAGDAGATLTLARVVATLQVVLATRRAARMADRAARAHSAHDL